MNMFYQFLHPRKIAVDNAVFKLHYKVSFSALILFSLLIGWKLNFGDTIDCEGAASFIKTERTVDDICWMQGTIANYYRNWERPRLHHPFMSSNEDNKLNHRNYRWLPLFLALTAFSFYLPRLIWNNLDNGIIDQGCKYLEYPQYDSEYLSDCHEYENMNAFVENFSEAERRRALTLLQFFHSIKTQ